MCERKPTATIAALILVAWIGVGSAAEIKDHWGDFLHYAMIGRFDLAKAHAQAILDSPADPEALFSLAEASPREYQILLRVRDAQSDPELAAVAGRVLALVEQGRRARRSDANVVQEQVNRLLTTTTDRGRMLAIQQLRDSGEYSVPFLLDALADPAREGGLDRIVDALSELGASAVRPLGAAVQATDAAVRVEVVRALGKIRSLEVLPYLKYALELDKVDEVRSVAVLGIRQVDPAAMEQSAAHLFFQSAQRYYSRVDSDRSGATGSEPTNVWLWDPNQQRLACWSVDSRIFDELTAMRYCEWALRADGTFGPAIGLWVASFFRAEAVGIPMPAYFGEGHAGAFVYATTAGPEYLHQALARAIQDKDAAVALGATEALILTAGERSVFAAIGSMQPLLQALTFEDRAVRTSAAIAVATAGPRGRLTESAVVVQNLADAVDLGAGSESPADANAVPYALRSAAAMLRLAEQRNTSFDLSVAEAALAKAVRSGPTDLKVLAAEVLAYLGTSSAQQTIADVALKADNDQDIRIAALGSLAVSAKIHGSLLADPAVDGLSSLVRSGDTPAELRAAAATAVGALSLPSSKVKGLILDQARD
ncbi:MAG: HEAT repeat domain-containing protein [Phycisphaerae bacterium]|nr:HEAT repeat domain-containing protein [Phycisphaerae bacterium]